jgi:hypothetical protein
MLVMLSLTSLGECNETKCGHSGTLSSNRNQFLHNTTDVWPPAAYRLFLIIEFNFMRNNKKPRVQLARGLG